VEENKFTLGEKEVLVLKAAMESINSMINYSMVDLFHKDPESSVIFKTAEHQKYFNILLLDFLHSRIFNIGTNCIKSLQIILITPRYNQNMEPLKNAVYRFEEWLNQEVEFEKDGEIRRLWFPSIDQNIALKITRKEFIEICGNISKHNMLGLNRQAKLIQEIFKRNEVSMQLTDAFLIMEEFYDQFHNDLFNYHGSAIAEFLNNIRWGIYEYLQPLYKKSLQTYWNEHLQLNSYRYIFPDDIKDSYIQNVFWDLMNDVRSKPYMPRFVVTQYLKMRY
jgi:hypothetical protein